ncbi:MAG: sensor domain-containing diguanylate cyclase [Microthrixaceae bacterium]
MDVDEQHVTGLEALAYRSFGEQFPVLMVLVDSTLEVTWASPGSRALLGCEPDELVGVSILDLVHPDDIDSTAMLASSSVEHAGETMASPAASTLVEFPVRVLGADGGWRSMNATGRVLGEDGTLLGVLRSASQVQALDAVISGLGAGGELDSVLRGVIDLARAQFKVDSAWIVHDARGVAEVVGPDGGPAAGRASLVLHEIRSAGLSPEVIVGPSTWSVPLLSSTGESLFGVLELPARRPGGPAPLDQHLLARVASLASLAFSRHRDDQLLAEAATTDYLTGVSNRRHFERRLAEVALDEGAMPFTLLYVDVDSFKSVNDTHGHKVGDEVLAAVARRLANAVRPGDFVGRLGGDEFAVGAPGLDADETRSLSERVARSVAEPISVGGTRVSVTASIGIARASDEDSLETILERGDDDMFLRKRNRSAPASAHLLPSAH